VMTKKIDFSNYKTEEVLVDVIGSRIEIKQNGTEYKSLCPFHDEKTPSFSIVPRIGRYYCFGCQASGDAVDFVMDYDGVDNKTARKFIDGHEATDFSGVTRERKPFTPSVSYYQDMTILPIPDGEILEADKETPDIWNAKKGYYSKTTPSMVFLYRDASGTPLSYVIRIDFGGGKKITPHIAWCRMPNGSEGWAYMPAPDNRPVYGVEYLDGSKKTIMVVEGEKAQEAADKIFGNDYDVVSPLGGTQSVAKTDWSIVKGRNVLLWSDMDQCGMNAFLGSAGSRGWKKGVADICIDEGAASVKYISLDKKKPKGWDAADAIDEGITKTKLINWAKKHIKTFVPMSTAEVTIDRDAVGGHTGHLDDNVPTDIYNDVQTEESGNVVQLPVTKKPEAWQTKLMMKDNKPMELEPRLTHNAMVLMQYHDEFEGVLAYNENSYTIDIVSSAPWDDTSSAIPRVITDSDYVEAKAWLEGRGLRLSANDVRGAILAVSHKRSYNPLRTYINGLEWDGVERLDSWLHYYLGVAKTEYSTIVGRRFLVGAIARGLRPGCKMDTMLILEGNQGVRKSTAVEALFSRQFFTDEIHNIGSKDASMQMQGMWCIEIAEMQAMNRAETNQIKEWITRVIDRFRPPYGHSIIESPRSCVLVGTLNPEGGYLKDATGARRFLPVLCTKINLQDLRADRDQLFAEAKHLYQNAEPWWYEVGSHEAGLIAAETEDRYEGDSWSDDIDAYLFGLLETTTALVLDALQIPKAQWSKSAETRIGKHLHKRGWHRKRVSRGGIRQYIYFKEG